MRLKLISNNEDLKKQIENLGDNFVLVNEAPEVVVIDEDEQQAKAYANIPTLFLSATKNLDGAINIKKPFLLVDFFEKLFSCQMVFENNPAFSLKWGNFELFINKKELYNSEYNVSYKLTEKEVDILKYFYKHKNSFISKKEFLEEVWGYNPEMTTHTTETHIYRLRQKVEPSSEPIIETLNGEYRLKK